MIFILPFILLFTSVSFAKVVEYHLTISKKTVTIGGRSSTALTVNGQVPGPTLRFRQGDIARIHVHNAMTMPTSLHWHGLLVPNGMDGVANLTSPPIPAGGDFDYEFPIRQSGTYWYHSHVDLQEQRGVYGAIVIDPIHKSVAADLDNVVVFSDWTSEDPHTILRNLKRGSEWEAVKKGTAQSLLGASRAQNLGAYWERELLRMPPMDLSDVAYDDFLANGHREIHWSAQPGQRVRVRIIDGGSMTLFYLQYAGGPMKIVSADGQWVRPIEKDRFLISPGETYDVIVQAPTKGSFELRATAYDGSGLTSVWIGEGERHEAPNVPKPDLYKLAMPFSWGRVFALTPSGSMGMSDERVESGMEHLEEHSAMEMHGHPMDDGGEMHMDHMNHRPNMKNPRPSPPYKDLRALQSTAFSSDWPRRTIRLTLDGDMSRYVWSINNRSLSSSDAIRIKKGEVVRFILINRTMMDHPMHLHGHFFRVLNGQGSYGPLKHTVDVRPMSTTVIEFKADEAGDWFFHCHLLYHMMSGMARVVHYQGFDSVSSSPHPDHWFAWGQLGALTSMTQGYVTASNSHNILTAEWEVGWQKVEKTNWESIFTYDRYFNRFLRVFAGSDVLGSGDQPMHKARGIAGVRYLLPLNIESRVWFDTDGGGRLDLDKEFALTARWSLSQRAEYDTHEFWEGVTQLNYMMSRDFSISTQYHSDFGWGGGVMWRF